MSRMNIDGLNELIDRVNQLGSVGDEIKKNALIKVAELVKETMEDEAPKSNLNKEHMADNIKISDIKSEEGTDYIEVGPTRDANSKFFYSKFTNYGTSKIPAQNWAEKSILQNKRKINQILQEELEKGLDEI